MPDLVGSYDRYFEVVRADTPALRDDVYRLRYQVYCVENPFENAAGYPDRRETDEDDDRSVHSLLVHRRSGAAAGTARLILPQLGAGRPLPIARVLRPRELAMFQRLPLHRMAEVSRFAVSKEFRRRCGEDRYADIGFAGPSADGEMTERRLVPHITFGLLRGILRVCIEYEIILLAAVMEPALLRILTRLGLDFEPIGGLIDYHGMRQPCIARIPELIRRSRDRADLLWRYVEADLPAIAIAAGPAGSDTAPRAARRPALSSARGFA